MIEVGGVGIRGPETWLVSVAHCQIDEITANFTGTYKVVDLWDSPE